MLITTYWPFAVSENPKKPGMATLLVAVKDSCMGTHSIWGPFPELSNVKLYLKSPEGKVYINIH
jgi:hypothetical protein